MPKLSLAKLERHLYAAADRLRQEGLDAATYKDYIFGMLFLKRCSDVFDAEREEIVSRRVLQGMTQDAAEESYAVISLPPNLFYGAGIPACILVMRPNLTGQSPNPNKPEARRGQVLFINADAEFHAGRAQNYLRPEHVEKIVSTFDRYDDVPGYARRVSLDEISGPANDWNLNIRRYVDNSPPPEPHDVRAHLLGGVPTAEVEARRALFEAVGFEASNAFAPRTAIVGDTGFGLRRHDAAFVAEPRDAASEQSPRQPAMQSGDMSPHSKREQSGDMSPHSKEVAS